MSEGRAASAAPEERIVGLFLIHAEPDLPCRLCPVVIHRRRDGLGPRFAMKNALKIVLFSKFSLACRDDKLFYFLFLQIEG